MDQAAFAQVTASFAVFHQTFAPLFGRKESQQRGEQYLRGLLVQQTDRRNAENVAEAIDGATPRALQRFLSESAWPTAPVISALQAYLAPRLASPAGVFVLDETGFPKQGRHSVGVARQYAGTLGKVGNCQLGVFLAYVSPRGRALIDHRLYLPHAWTDDPDRCRAAGVPATVTYQSKADLGLAMLRQAQVTGQLPGGWVTADADYGKTPSLRDALGADGWCYVLEVPSITPIFERRAATEVPSWSGRGRRPTQPRLVTAEPGSVTVAALAASVAVDDWQVLTVAEGSQGPRVYQCVARRVWEARAGLPGDERWLLVRRHLDGSDAAYFLSNAPTDTPLLTLAQVATARWPIETEFQTEKGETGLDEYEVRGWRGWQHHVTLSLLAGAFLLTIQQAWGEKDAAGDPATGQPGAARTPATAALDRAHVTDLAGRYPTAQRQRDPLTRQTATPGQITR
jgi:SRSO17 transposase